MMGRHFKRKLLVSWLLLCSAAPVAMAARDADILPMSAPQLSPQVEHANLDQAIAGLLSHFHYRQSKLDDELSGYVLDSYLNSLDVNRVYFLERDIATFRRYRFTLDNSLRAGDLGPAYAIFNVYQDRMADRTRRIHAQLNEPMDFSIDESLELDRQDAPWASTHAELDEIWRKRLKNELLSVILSGKDLDEARKILERRYDGRQRRTAQSTSEDVFQLYMNAVAQSFDPHTAYFSPRATENFNIQMRLSLEGIGTVLRMEDEQITIVELVPGGPADLSKQIQPDDHIIGVGQGNDGTIVDVVGWRLDDVVDLIRGRRGSIVRLKVVSANEGIESMGKTVRLVRDTIKLESQAARSDVRDIAADGREFRIGIITIPTFYSDFAAAQRGDANYRSTTRDVRRLLRELRRRNVDGVVVDLRQNGGGSLQEAVELTGLFIKEGPVVQVRNSSGRVDVERDPDPAQIYSGPLAVLVDRFSASASEIFAGAIQDYGRGVVIGEQTFGKGTVQTLIDLNRFVPNSEHRLGQLKLTIAKFYRVNGSSTQHRGVVPDISLPSIFGSEEVGESAQEHALKWDEIPPTRYYGSLRLTSVVPELARRHQTRMRSDPGLRTLLEDIEAVREARERTKISLRKGERQAEIERLEEKQRERENERRQVQGLPPLSKGEELSDSRSQDIPDLALDESVQVVADLAHLLNPAKESNSSHVVMSGRK